MVENKMTPSWANFQFLGIPPKGEREREYDEWRERVISNF